MRWLQGCLHAHSCCSDGSADAKTILRLAQEAELDFFMLSDHDTLAARDDVPSGRHGDLLWIVGVEISPKHSHYLAFGVQETVDRHLSSQEIIDAVRKAGGIGLIAHPDDRGSRLLRLPPYHWLDRSVQGFDGLEIWNAMSDFVGAARSLGTGARRLRDFASHLEGPPPETLAYWDRLQREHPIAAVAGLDVHAHRVGLGPLGFEVFPYRHMMQSLRNHVWITGDVSEASLLRAIAAGQLYMANHRFGDARGFRFYASPGVEIGASTEAPATLTVQSPLAAEITLLRHGVPAASASGQTLTYEADEPGVYRVEAKRSGKPWLFTNAIRVL